jgi:HEPN domain-containing protein
MGITMARSPLIAGEALETAHWIRWADSDYLAARLLLMNGAIPQGAALANTAIEKYLKAISVVAGLKVPRTHDVLDLYKTLLKTEPTTLDLNNEFLKVLRKAYLLRYPDELEDGFNISMNAIKILAQTDRSVHEITRRFVLLKKDKRLPMVLEQAVKDKESSFLMGNVAVFPENTAELFKQRSKSFDLRKHRGTTLEAVYVSEYSVDDLKFDVQGFKRLSDRKFELGHPPVVASQPQTTDFNPTLVKPHQA